MALSPTLSFVPFIGLDTLCTVADGPATRYAILGGDGYVGLNTGGDTNLSVDPNPLGREGSLRLLFLLIVNGYNAPTYVQIAVNNPPGVLGLQAAADKSYTPDCYDPSRFYPKCSAQISQTQYGVNGSTIPAFSSYTLLSSPDVQLSPSAIGPVRAYNQYEATHQAGLSNVGQQGCTIVQLILPSTEGLDTLLQVDIDFCQTSAS